MVMVGVASGSLQAAYRRTQSPGRLALAEGRRLLGAVPHSSYEPGEFLQWFRYDDSTITVIIMSYHCYAFKVVLQLTHYINYLLTHSLTYYQYHYY